jgi:acyl-CoA synthetase (AMP-forming)/AMP-acid ligase II
MSRIGIIGDNSIEYIDKLLEIWKKGDSAVLIDWRIPVDKILQMLYEAGASKCYIDDRLFDSFKNINDLEFDFYHSCNEGKLMKIPQYLYDKFADLIITCDEALILYSSGTTGKSKGVILSMNAIYQNCISIVEYMNLNHSDVLCITKPLSHSSSLTGELLVILKSKVEGYICSSLTLPSRVLKYVKKYNISRLFLNPQLLRVYSNEINKKDYDINCLKKIYTSGSILNETVYQKSKIAFRDVEIINGYGLSEAGPRVTTQELSNVRDHSAGKPIKNVELIIVNDDGNMCKNGNRGYIHIKSHSMFMGYVVGCAKHKNLVDGWFNTGDIG